MHRRRRAQLENVDPDVARDLAAIGQFWVRPLTTDSRMFVWDAPWPLDQTEPRFDLEWRVTSDQDCLDPDARMFELWKHYSASHLQRFPEFTALLYAANRSLPAQIRRVEIATPREVWKTVRQPVLEISRYERKRVVTHTVSVRFGEDWDGCMRDRREATRFVWDEVADRFVRALDPTRGRCSPTE